MYLCARSGVAHPEMNIFFLSWDPRECARWLVDRHAVKMVLEYAQLLCTAHRVLDGERVVELSKSGRRVARFRLADAALDARLYAATHAGHPCAAWARASAGNYDLLLAMFAAALDEYNFRYSKTHACAALLPLLARLPRNIPAGGATPPALAMPEAFRSGDAVKSYRRYYAAGKRHLFAWRRRGPPPWLDAAAGGEYLGRDI